MTTRRATLWALAFSAVTFAVRLPFVRLPFDPTDEGYYAAVAQATARGERLYTDLWYVRPPFLNTVYEWAYRASLASQSPYDLAVRVLAALFAAATVGVFAWFLFTELSPRPAFLGAAMAALFGASIVMQNEANAETWMMLPYVLAAVLVLVVALRDPPARRALTLIALAGALTGVAGAFKQVALVNLALPIVAWLAFDVRRVSRWLGLTAAYVGGAIAAWAAILAVVAARDDLRSFLYFAWARNFSYASISHQRFDAVSLIATKLGGPVIALAVVGAIALALFAATLLASSASPRSRAIALFAFGWLCVSAIGISTSGRYYEHYFIQATMPAVLLLAASADALLPAAQGRRLASIAVTAALAVALAAPAISWALDVRGVPAKYASRKVYKDLAKRLTSLAPPGGDFLVWGIDASVRAYSPLRHSTTLIMATYNYGWSPIARGSLLGKSFPSTADVVLADIRQSPPDLIVLTSPLRPPSAELIAQSRDGGIRIVTELYDVVERDYEVVEQGPAYTVLRRKR